MKFYDKGNKRIIIFEKLATYEFWDMMPTAWILQKTP